MKKLINRLLLIRHPWRYVGFDELSELYTSTMLRSMGISVVGVFVPIYLYKLEYGIVTVCLFMAGVFLSRVVFDVVAGFVVARIGPKHTILLSNILQIMTLALFLTLSHVKAPLWVIALLWGLSLSLFFIAYHVDFSKIMHKERGGKELGYMTMLERIGAALGPLVGGIIATFVGPEYTIMVAIILFMAATLPLFMTNEPTRVHQTLNFRGLPIRKLRRDGISYFAMGIDASLSVSLWPFFAAISILTVNTYASVGMVTSLGIVAAILSASFIGSVVDRDKGKTLFQWSAAANGLLHVLRPGTGAFSGVLLVNIANEVLSAGYRMPYSKGMYARADDLPGFRIVYIIFMEVIVDAGKAVVWLAVAGLCFYVSAITAMQIVFVGFGLLTFAMLAQKFPALNNPRVTSP